MKIDNSSTIGSIHIDNNDWFPFPWKFLADLEVSESKIIWEKNKKSIHCLIKNKGNADSGEFYIRFYTKEKNKSKRFLMQRWVPQLKVGETFKYDFNIMRIAHNYKNNLNDVEEFIIKVDYNNKVKESNEKNNIEVIDINTHHRPTPSTLNLNNFYPIDSHGDQYTKINFDLKKIKVISTEDTWGADEPFLWVYGIQIDLQTLIDDNYVVKSKNYGHRNVKSLNDGKSATISSDVGHIVFDVTPIPIITAAGLGIVVIALEEDAGPSNYAMKQGYRAGAKRINDVIKNLKKIKKLKKLAKKVNITMTGIDIEDILKELQKDVERAISTAVNHGLIRWSLDHIISDIFYAVGATVDSDDKIGSFSEFVSYNDIKEDKNKNFSHHIRGDGAHYAISGSIAAQKPNNYYKSFKHQLKIGDIVLFSGESGEVQLFTNSKWSHVGVVFKEATDSSDVVLLEATPAHGVHLVSLKEKVDDYDGDISFRHLNVKRTSSMKRALINLYRELRGRAYESRDYQGARELSNAAIDTLDKNGGQTLNHEDLSKVFCSELVAEAYQRMGLLSSNDPLYPSNEFTPKDFSEEKELDLLKGELLMELIIKK